MFHYPKGIVSNYCYNIFLFRQFNSTKWNSINSIKRKVIFLCLGWMNGMEWNCVIASSIKKSKLFFNYWMIGYMFCLHSHSNSILHLIQPFNFLYYLQTLQFSYCLNILSWPFSKRRNSEGWVPSLSSFVGSVGSSLLFGASSQGSQAN